MRRSGFVVRFVDVVLILLFGFISISSIRVTEVDLLAIEKNVLTVGGLDAVDGTPVLDLKPA